MIFAKQLRSLLLVGTFVGVLCVLGRSILNPGTVERRVTSFEFPQGVPLPGWQPLESTPIDLKNAERPSFRAGRHYRYVRSDDVPLDIEIRYLAGGSMSIDVKRFIGSYTSIRLSPGNPVLVLRQQQGVGFYSLFTHQARSYLSACINPRGGSTVTYEQFNRNWLVYNLRFSRLLPLLLDQESLRDRRCLWAHLSIPLKQLSPESSYPILEEAWFAWYQWWSPRFPKP